MHVNQQLKEAGKIQGGSHSPWSEIGKPAKMILGNKGADVVEPGRSAAQQPLIVGEQTQHWSERWTAL
jgi:hypothetical protein